MNASLRRNACPSLAAPMATGDGLLVRLNTISGAISPKHLLTIADAANRHGNGILEVTRRGSLQIRGLTEASAGILSEEIEASGIDIRTGVPIDTGPLAGLDPTEAADPRPLIAELRRLIAESALSSRLGPKVSVVVDGGGRLHMDDVQADIRVAAIGNGIRPLWKIEVGDPRPFDPDRPSLARNTRCVVRVVIDLLKAIADIGRFARGRNLPEASIIALTDLLLPEIIMQAPRRPAQPVGRFALKGGGVALGIGLPFGQASCEMVVALAKAASEVEVAEFRIAPGRALLAICGEDAAASRLEHRADDLGFIVDAADPRCRVIACAGAPACASAHIDTKSIAAEIAAMDPSTHARGPIHVSGCAKNCAEPPEWAYALQGTGCGVSILDGISGSEIISVAEGEAVAAFQRVVRPWDVGREAPSVPTAGEDRKAS